MLQHTKVFISYARKDDEAFAKKLCADLTKHGFEIWWDRESLHSVQLTFHQQIKDAIRSAIDRLIYISGPAASISDYVREEWLCALEFEKPVIPILRHGDFNTIPGDICLLHCEDFRDDALYAAQLEKLIANLNRPEPPIGRLFAVPNLPPHFLGRPDILRKLKDAVQIDLQAPLVITGSGSQVGLQGMGGIGKSVLAAAVARDREVRRSYPDGIIWISFKQLPDILQLMRELARHLGDKADFQSVAVGQGVLRTLLLDKAVLLVMDDIWKASDAKTFDFLGPRCRALITTRDAGILHTLNGKMYPVELFTNEEALQLLADSVETTTDKLPKEAREIVKECGCLPLAVALCGGLAKKRGGGWESILYRLKHADLEKIEDRQSINEQHINIWRAMQISVEILEQEKQCRFAELSVFVTDQTIPQAAVATLWAHTGNLNEYDSEDLIQELFERSLIRLDKILLPEGKENQRISLHDLLYDYAGKITKEPVALKQQLLDAYKNRCTDGWFTGPNDGYFLQNLCYHLLEVGKLDECVDTLCDLNFIQSKAAAKLTYELIKDINYTLQVIPDNAENIRQEKLRQARMDKYTRDLITCAKGEISLEELEIPESINPWTKEQIDLEIERIKTNPTKADLLKDFINFLGNESSNLQNYASEFAYFTHQQAWNYVAEGPVGKVAGKLAPAAGKFLLRRIPPIRPPYNPIPQAVKTLSGHTDYVNAVSITPDGKRAISASDDENCIIWDLETGLAVKTLSGHTDTVDAVSITPDGKRAISGSSDKTCILWDLKTGQAVKTLTGHTDQVRAVSITPDGKRAISASRDKNCIIWDIETGQAVKKLSGHTDQVRAVSITPDGKRAISASDDKNCIIWNIETGQAAKTLSGHTDRVNAVSITPNGKRAISASRDKNCIIWDLETGQAVKKLSGHTGGVGAVSITPDGKRAISASWDNTCIFWNMETGQAIKKLSGHTDDVNAVSITPDGKRAISASEDRNCIIWDIETGQAIKKLSGHTYYVNAVSITPDGKRAISASEDRNCIIWDIETGQAVKTLSGHNGVTAVSITPDGKRAISASSDKNCIIWDLETGQAVKMLSGQTYWVRAVSITPDGKRAISAASDKNCIIWDIETGQAVKTLSGHVDYVNAVSITPDGKGAISASDDRSCIIWDLETEQAVKTLSGHIDRVRAVSITPDGKRAISASDDKNCIIWDIETGQAVKTLTGHTDRINAVSITPDGKRAISASDDKNCIIWNLETGEQIARLIINAEIYSVAIISKIIVLGCGSGEVLILNAEKELICLELPITTIRQIWDFELQQYQELSADCPLCGHRFAPPGSVLATIAEITKKAGLKPEQSPCLELPDEAWEDPGLLGFCPECGEELKFNPFVTGGDLQN